MPANFKLGKLAKVEDPRTLQIANYIVPSALPLAPKSFKWDSRVKKWPMYRNDEIGDCTCAAPAHQEQLWTAAVGTEVDVAEPDVVKMYAAVSGFNPATMENDNGAVILDVLNYWRKTGLAGHKIGAFAEVNIGNKQLVEDAIYLFGGLIIGLNLPLATQDQGKHWKIPKGGVNTANGHPGGWGGHCVYVLDYSPDGLTCISWGDIYSMTWGYFHDYCDEAWVVFSQEFLKVGLSPQGFNMQALLNDLSQIGQVQT